MNINTSREWDGLWDFDEPAGSEERLCAFLPRVTDASHRNELKTQIARSLGLQRKFNEAHTLLDEVQQALTDQMPIARVRYLLERGRVFNSSGQRAEAKPLFLKAVEKGTEATLDGYVVDALHMLAIVETEASAQHDWNLRAMALAESSGDPTARRWLATLYNNIGWTYYDQKKYNEAMDVFRKAIPLREEAGKVIPLRIAHYAVGKTLRAMGKLDEALAIQRRLDEAAERDGSPDGFICEEIGECLLALGRPDEARPYFRRAYKSLSADVWLVQNESARVDRLRVLAAD